MTIDKVLNNAMELTPYDRSMLVDILKKRQIEENRNEIFEDSLHSIRDYENGMFEALTAKKAKKELAKILDETDE